MRTLTTFTTFTDLRNWVAEHVSSAATDADVEAVAEAIRSDPTFPGWDKPCNAYLDSLPDNLPEWFNSPSTGA